MVNNSMYNFTTGGGFSNYTALPTWQQAAVTAYLKSGATFPPSYAFHPGNRAYPDCAAFGARVLVISGGSISVDEGTSASTPIIAGVVSLLNDKLISSGKPALGFFNQVFYQMAAACPNCFNTMLGGNNKSSAEGMVCEYGYYVTPASAFSAVTGIGSINYSNALAWLEANLP